MSYRAAALSAFYCLLGGLAGAAFAQSAGDLVADASEPNDVLTYGLNRGETLFIATKPV